MRRHRHGRCHPSRRLRRRPAPHQESHPGRARRPRKLPAHDARRRRGRTLRRRTGHPALRARRTDSPSRARSLATLPQGSTPPSITAATNRAPSVRSPSMRRARLFAATSTGGTCCKLPGRVGDSPLIGCGCYADSEAGGVSCTGYGEAIMKVVLAKTAVDFSATRATAPHASPRRAKLPANSSPRAPTAPAVSSSSTATATPASPSTPPAWPTASPTPKPASSPPSNLGKRQPGCRFFPTDRRSFLLHLHCQKDRVWVESLGGELRSDWSTCRRAGPKSSKRARCLMRLPIRRWRVSRNTP